MCHSCYMAINGKRISTLIEEHGLSRNELSLRSGIPYNTLKRRLESGRGWELDELQQVADAIGIRVTDLLSQAEVERAKCGSPK